MKRKIVLYGAGNCGKKALEWFGRETVEYFIDNNKVYKNTGKYGKKVISFNDFCNKNRTNIDVVISMEYKWVVHQIAYELERNGISKYSVFSDVVRRWEGPEAFLQREVEIYPCEHESVNTIRLAQNEWLLRHTDVKSLTPAIGRLRDKQLRILSYTKKAFEEFEAHLGIRPIMEAGTLLGALRHKGFVPWDYDLDFCIPRWEYNILCEYLINKYRVYVLADKEPANNSWKTIGEERVNDFDVFMNYGEISLAIRDDGKFCGFDTLNKNRIVDITPLDTFSNDATIDTYRKTINDFRDIWDVGGDFDRMIVDFHNQHPELSEKPYEGCKLGRATDVAVGCAYVSNPGRWFDRQLYEYDEIYETVLLEFEDTTFWAPADYDSVTRKMYGNNYMELPNRYGVHKENPELLFEEEY